MWGDTEMLNATTNKIFFKKINTYNIDRRPRIERPGIYRFTVRSRLTEFENTGTLFHHK